MQVWSIPSSQPEMLGKRQGVLWALAAAGYIPGRSMMLGSLLLLELLTFWLS